MCFRVWGENRNKNWKDPLCSDVTTTCYKCSLLQKFGVVPIRVPGIVPHKMKSLEVISGWNGEGVPQQRDPKLEMGDTSCQPSSCMCTFPVGFRLSYRSDTVVKGKANALATVLICSFYNVSETWGKVCSALHCRVKILLCLYMDQKNSLTKVNFPFCFSKTMK